LITLTVSLIFDFDVTFDGVRGAKVIDLYRVVNNQFGWCQWVDQLGVSTQVHNGFTHRSQVNNTGNTSEVLHQDASRSELNFGVGLSGRIPVGQGLDLLLGDVLSVFCTEQVL